ncbi:MAG TPA: GNAT family N-acetyltransferase [Solirubrobacteraceae bacterium]|nr:GNAT family N-acetyltransferase [Solirubrobacteraceae bacterium]
MTAPRWTVRPPTREDFGAWRRLYAAYADFYAVEQSEEDAARVWDWIHDPGHEVECLLLERDGRVLGLAHVREFARPLASSAGGFLDDLFIDAEARGAGGVDALMAALRQRGAERGWTVIRWITADGNHRAQRVYDRVATRTRWVTYDMDVEKP